jgi:hypothetical protein
MTADRLKGIEEFEAGLWKIADTRQQLQEFAGWTKKKTFDTYWSKQIKPFVVDISGGQYRVSEAW